MSCILAPIRFAYPHTGFAYADILSYTELMLVYAHQSFAYATPLPGAPSQTWTQGFSTWLKYIQFIPWLPEPFEEPDTGATPAEHPPPKGQRPKQCSSVNPMLIITRQV